MNRKITEEESEKLFQFCAEHKVEHYDLQVELVDHLASYIEEKWEINTELEFQNLLMESYGKFGIYKFSKMKEQKEKELQRKYTNLRMKYFREFYRWPKILSTLVFTIGVFMLLKLTSNFKQILLPVLLFSIVLVMFYHFYYVPKKLKLIKTSSKRFLLIDHLKNVKNSVAILIFVPVSLLNIIVFDVFDLQIVNLYNQLESNWIIFIISFLIVSFYISLYSFSIFLPQKIKEHFKEQFPEFAL